ncbi:MAG: FAD-binding protein, partial [Deltaproteobacteria bacterium]|nr:FAD-binding protein [Deltaproteobacteria bacterium]
MNEQIKLLFVQRFKGRVLFNESMSAYTSIGIGGAADVMAFPLDEADLIDVLTFAKSKKYPVFILGLGANLLVRDGGIRGVVINMADGFKDITIDAENLKVKADAGVLLSKLISKCAKKGMSGLEFAEGIPGTVGGAVSMNAGAYGGEMKDVVNGVEILRYEGKKNIKKEFIGSKELNFAYRSADVPKGSVVVSAFF